MSAATRRRSSPRARPAPPARAARRARGRGRRSTRPATQLERRGRRRLEEPAVVRDEDHRGVERGEPRLEPLDRRDVEVVRRLVEQQQVGVAAERARERGARQLAAREGRERPVEVVVDEAEPAEHRRRRGRASRSRRRARAGPASSSSGAASAGRARPRPSPPRGGAAPPRARRGRRRPRARTRAACPRRLARRALVVQRDPRALRERDLAALQLGLARERAQERRLAGAVRAGEREPVAALDLERDAVEERVAGELLAQVRGDQDGHRSRVDGVVTRVLALDVGSSSTRALLARSTIGTAVRAAVDERTARRRTRPARAGGARPGAAARRARAASRARATAERRVDAILVLLAQPARARRGRSAARRRVLTWSDVRSAPQAARACVAARRGRRHARTGLPAARELLAREARVARGPSSRTSSARRAASSASPTTCSRASPASSRTSLSMASGTGLLDCDDDWDAELLDALGVEPEQLPPVSDEPVDGGYPALGDGACSNVGAGCTTPGRAALMVGTSGALRVVRARRRPPPRRGLFRYRVDGRRLVEGGSLSDGGNLLRVARGDARRLPTRTASPTRPAAGHGLTFLPLPRRRAQPRLDAEAPRRDRRAPLRDDCRSTSLQAGARGCRVRARRDRRPDARGRGGRRDRRRARRRRDWMQILADVLERPLASRPSARRRCAAPRCACSSGSARAAGDAPVVDGRRAARRSGRRPIVQRSGSRRHSTRSTPRASDVTANDVRKLSIDTIRDARDGRVQKANAGHPGHRDGARAARLPALPRTSCGTTRRTRSGRTATASSSRAGHASILLYAALHLTGYDLSLDELKRFRQWGLAHAGPPGALPHRRASRRRPARSARASRTASAWRSPSASSPSASTARATRSSTTASTRSAPTAT